MEKVQIISFIVCISILCISANIHAEEDENTDRHKLNSWLSIAGKGELELLRQRIKPVKDDPTIRDYSTPSSTSFLLSIDFEAQVSERISGVVAFEFDDVKKRFLVDEAIVKIELEKTKIGFGRGALPFGEYHSRFITGSPVDFFEINEKNLTISRSLTDEIDLSLFAYNGKAKKVGADSRSVEWGISTEIMPTKRWTIGLGYVSDLADADEISLEDTGNRYEKRVSGLAIHSTLEVDKFGFTTEYIAAIGEFKEFDTDKNKPRGWNFELTHFLITEKLEWSVRFAGGNEIEDEPHCQTGVAGTWHINNQANVTLEYLQNDYKIGLAEDDLEQTLDRSNQIAGRLEILF